MFFQNRTALSEFGNQLSLFAAVIHRHIRPIARHRVELGAFDERGTGEDGLQTAPFINTAIKHGYAKLIDLAIPDNGLLFPVAFAIKHEITRRITPATNDRRRAPAFNLRAVNTAQLDQITAKAPDAVALLGPQNRNPVDAVKSRDLLQAGLIKAERLTRTEIGRAGIIRRCKHRRQRILKAGLVPGLAPGIVFPEQKARRVFKDRQDQGRARLGLNERHTIAVEHTLDRSRIKADSEIGEIAGCAALLILDFQARNHFRCQRRVDLGIDDQFADLIEKGFKVERCAHAVLGQRQSLYQPPRCILLALAHGRGLRLQRIGRLGIDADIGNCVGIARQRCGRGNQAKSEGGKH